MAEYTVGQINSGVGRSFYIDSSCGVLAVDDNVYNDLIVGNSYSFMMRGFNFEPLLHSKILKVNE